MNALEETKYKIAHGGNRLDANNRIVDDVVGARIKGEPRTCDREEVDFMDVSNDQTVAAATALIPFLEHNPANRALMGANMQRQAVPPVRPQAPHVGTGIEDKIARDSARAVVAPEDGEIIEVEPYRIEDQERIEAF